MQLLDQYIRLCAGCRKTPFGQPFEISLAEVAAILYCTLRNATLTLKKMQNQGWLVWQPGRGRGNRSVLTCSVAPTDLVLSVAKEWVQKGEIRSSRELISRHQNEWPVLAKDFSRWMSSLFGPSVTREKGKAGRIDTLRLFVDRPIPMMDPVHVLLRDQAHLAKHLFDCLVRFDPQKKSIEPQLAFYWETDHSGREWTFYLRKGVLFHHGRTLAAEDVCYSLLRLEEQKSWHRWLVQSIQSVTAVDDHVVQIFLHEPDELFLHTLSKEYLAIVPRDYVGQMEEKFARLPVGTGPFRVVRNDDSMLVMEAFEPYFGGRPFLDRIEVWCVPGFRDERGADRGQHLMRVSEKEEIPGTGDSSWRGVSRQQRCFQYVSLNGAKAGPLRCESFRRAVSGMINGDDLRVDMKGSREPAEEWGEALSFHEQGQTDYPTDIANAFQESGYAGEALSLYTYPDPDHVEDAEWIKERCARHGIAIQIIYALPDELAQSAMLQEADLIVDSANVDEREEVSLLEFLYGEAVSIRHHLASSGREKVDRQVQSLRSAKSGSERRKHMVDILKTLHEERVFVPLYSNRIEMLAHPSLSGVSLDAYGWIDFTRVFFRL